MVLVHCSLLNEIYPLGKFEVNISNTFGDMLRTKMWDGRTDGRNDGRTDGDYYHIPRRLFGGGKKGEMLIASIFSFSHGVFYSTKEKNCHIRKIYFVVCKCFQFGHIQFFFVWL